MSYSDLPGTRFRKALKQEKPLQIAGVMNAYCGLMAEQSGFKALYLSGGAMSAGALGLPDLGYLTLEDVTTELRRLTRVTKLPVLVDVDTGFGDIRKTVQELSYWGAAAMQMEDQVETKRCGHRPGKKLVTAAQMVDRVKRAVDARKDPSFVIIARCDALSVEGKQGLMDRMGAYVRAGADMVFPEAVDNLFTYKEIAKTLKVPVLANITEFGLTPLFTARELEKAGVSMALYPLSAFRAANLAALKVYLALRSEGTQKSLVKTMQTREELYQFLDYHQMEKKLDQKLKTQSKKIIGGGK